MEPLVSVITTLYNCEKYVHSSIESVLAQDFTDFELILVNDGSTDGTWEIASAFDDARIVRHDYDENKRIPFRRNEAIAGARGKYIAIHDGDDESLPTRLSTEVGWMESHEGLFCVGSHAVKMNAEGEVTGFMDYPPSSHNEIVLMLRQGRNPVIDPTTLFRRDVFLELGCYTLDDSIYTVPDLDLWARAVLAEKRFRNIPTHLIKYRINPDGVTRKHKPEMIRAHSKVIRQFVRDLIVQRRQKYEKRYTK